MVQFSIISLAHNSKSKHDREDDASQEAKEYMRETSACCSQRTHLWLTKFRVVFRQTNAGPVLHLRKHRVIKCAPENLHPKSSGEGKRVELMRRGCADETVAATGTVYLRPPRGQSVYLLCSARTAAVEQRFLPERF